MRLVSILGEAWRDIVSGTTRAALFACVFVLLIGSLALADVRQVVGVLQAGSHFSSSGAATEVLKLQAGGGIVDGTRCDSLGSTAGVDAAGAIRQSASPLSVFNMPSDKVTTLEVTPGVITMLAHIAGPVELPAAATVTAPGASATPSATATAATAGATAAHSSARHPLGDVWLSSDLASQIGARPGQSLQTSLGSARVGGIYQWPDDGRMSDLGYAMLLPVAASGSFDQCWAQVWPQDSKITSLLYTSLNGDGLNAGTQVSLSQLNAKLGADYSVSDALSGRMTAPAPLVAGLAGLLIGFIAWRIRRLEIASNLHSHARRTDILWQALIETAAWVLAALVVCAAGLLLAAGWGNPESSLPTWEIGLRSVVVGACAVLLGSLAGALSSREKFLFRYAKDR